MTTESAAKRNTQKLQRAVVDGLEDVKAQDIQVFDTEHLTSLFERVVVASGTSNRQTKALAASVRDAVRDAGFPKPRSEGEGNGEWIIVDCGQVVVHIMQPTFRSYYHLEELWGEKPVRLKFGASKPVAAQVVAKQKPAARGAAAKKAGVGKPPARAAETGKLAPARALRTATPQSRPVAGKTAAAKTATAKTSAASPVTRKATAAKPTTTKATTPSKIKTVVVSRPSSKRPAAAKRGAPPAKAPRAKAPARKA